MREAVITALLTSSLMCGATEDHTQFKLQKGTHKPIYPWKTVKFQSAYPRPGRGGAGTYTRLRHCRQAVAGPDNHSHLRSVWSHRFTPSVWLAVEYLESLQRKAPDWIRISKTKWWTCDECLLTFFFFCCGDHHGRSSASIWPDPQHAPPFLPSWIFSLFFLFSSAGSSISSAFSPAYPPSRLITCPNHLSL